MLLREGASANCLTTTASAATAHDGKNTARLSRQSQYGTPVLVSLLIESREHSDIVQALLKAGANPNAHVYLADEEREGSSALFLAYVNHYWRSMKLLLDHGANPNRGWYVDHPYLMPLEWIARESSPQAALLLLDHGAQIDALSNGYTALMSAAGSGNEAMVQLLLKRGAKPNIVSRYFESTTALNEARRGGFERIVQLLLHYGAK